MKLTTLEHLRLTNQLAREGRGYVVDVLLGMAMYGALVAVTCWLVP